MFGANLARILFVIWTGEVKVYKNDVFIRFYRKPSKRHVVGEWVICIPTCGEPLSLS